MQLIFLHAFPLNPAMWEQQETIAPGRSIYPDLYSLGSSLEEWAESVFDLISKKEPVVIIGSSMGGSCAIEMARQAPERVAGLILVGAKPSHHPEPQVRDEFIESLCANGLVGVWPELSNWFSSTTPTEVIDLALSIGHQQSTEDLINAVRVFHGRKDLEHVLCEWKKPYLIINGDQDPMFPKHKSERISKLGPSGKLHIMSDCGHFVNLESPLVFNHVVSEFIGNANLD